MITTPKVRKLTKAELASIVHTGLITRVAKKTGLSVSTVSRTLKGNVRNPNQKVVAALEVELNRLEKGRVD